MKRTELINKIASPARTGYEIVCEVVNAAENTSDVYNDLLNLQSELARVLNNLDAAAGIQYDLED